MGYRKKKYNGKRGNRTSPSTNIVRQVTTFPDRQYIKMRWNILYNGGSASTSNRYVVRGNSIYDPEQTSSTGGVPFGYDQISGIYDNYRVLGSKYKVEIMPGDNGNGNYVKFALYPTRSLTDYQTDSLAEEPYSKSCFVGGSAATSRRFMTSYMSTKKLFGVKSIEQQESFSGLTGGTLVGSNPANVWYWVLDFDSVAGAPIGSTWLNITVVYYVELFNRKTLGVV